MASGCMADIVSLTLTNRVINFRFSCEKPKPIILNIIMINKCQPESQPVIYVNLHFILCFIISSRLGFYIAEKASIPCDLLALNQLNHLTLKVHP